VLPLKAASRLGKRTQHSSKPLQHGACRDAHCRTAPAPHAEVRLASCKRRPLRLAANIELAVTWFAHRLLAIYKTGTPLIFRSQRELRMPLFPRWGSVLKNCCKLPNARLTQST